jgi:hypothetical protein
MVGKSASPSELIQQFPSPKLVLKRGRSSATLNLACFAILIGPLPSRLAEGLQHAQKS